MPFFAASDFDALSLLIAALIYGLMAFLRRKGKQAEEPAPEEYPEPAEPPPQPVPRSPETPAPQPQPQRTAGTWAEEIEKMLQKELGIPTEEPPPPAPAPVPPVVHAPPPIPHRMPQPEPEPAYRRPPAFEEAEVLEEKAAALDRSVEERMSGVTGRMGTLESSTQAFERARMLDEKVGEYLKHVTDKPVALTRAVQRNTTPVEITRVLATLRHPQTARQAILASVILGPPKALEG